MKYSLSIFLIVFLFACTPPNESQETASEYVFQDPTFHENYATLEPHLQHADETVYIVNFWATWCGPCVKELPYFEQLHNTFADKKVKVLLVSLDFPDQIQKKLIPFIKDKQLKSELHVLTDGDMNSWIPKVDKDWSGAIPATLVYNKAKRAFYEQSFDSFDELTHILKPFLKEEQ